MKATQEMDELRAAIEAAGASEKLTHCTVLAGELATRIAQMETKLEAIMTDACESRMRALAIEGLLAPEYPKPRSFGRSNTKPSQPGH